MFKKRMIRITVLAVIAITLGVILSYDVYNMDRSESTIKFIYSEKIEQVKNYKGLEIPKNNNNIIVKLTNPLISGISYEDSTLFVKTKDKKDMDKLLSLKILDIYSKSLTRESDCLVKLEVE